MGLFYPTTFGIVGQKMTFLQYRSQGDSEDPYDEHYLLATQSKQDQVTNRFVRFIFKKKIILHLLSFFSLLNQPLRERLY